jgi:hypothetical protein
MSSWFELIKISFLPKDMKEAYIELIQKRAERLDLILNKNRNQINRNLKVLKGLFDCGREIS